MAELKLVLFSDLSWNRPGPFFVFARDVQGNTTGAPPKPTSRADKLDPTKKVTYFHRKLLQSKIWSQNFSLSRCVQTPLAQHIILSRTWCSKQPHHERWVEVPNVFLFILPIDGGNGVPLNTKWSQWQKPPGPKWRIQDKYPNTGHKGMSIYIHMHIL